ncbi:MAG TPA: poly(R)-hydroxyalkanoic acid synthase subunit PhaE [Flavipsychrobacter sp.]|nr:poly(R)-hydroxyalkanoic acid synthase subunit PhaE [Flavipsychrobacter sp.]
MASQDNQNFVDNVVDAQKKAIDTVVENTTKLTGGNALVNETMQKGSEWYKNWLDSQKDFFTQTTTQATSATENAKDNVSKMNEFYQNWFNSQMNWTKQIWEMNSNWMKNATNQMASAATVDANPMAQWNNNVNNWMTNWNNWTTGMANNASWMNNMSQWQGANPFNMDSWKSSGENWNKMFNEYYQIINNNFAEWQKNFQNGTVQDAYRNMVNVADGMTRFYEMWMPMWKSIQEKTFNADVYKQFMNPELYKDLMDKYFGFMPENARKYFQEYTNAANNGMKQFGELSMSNYKQFRDLMGTTMPWLNTTQGFEGMLNSYNTWSGMMNSAAAPFTKMMTPNQYTKTMMEWNDISNRMMVYNIKNAELQYLIYAQGAKVMDQLAENTISKIQSGQEINSLMSLYQEWLNIGDKNYVALFESDEYSKLMAEVSAMQLKLRKDVEHQMEKMMVGIPVATRSEMDELYKTIYELKKQVRELERSLEGNNTEDSVEEKNEEEKVTRRASKKN